MRRRSVAKFARQEVALHTRDGHSLRGVLVDSYRDCVVLRHVVDLDSGAGLEGEVVILKANISYFQVVEAAA